MLQIVFCSKKQKRRASVRVTTSNCCSDCDGLVANGEICEKLRNEIEKDLIQRAIQMKLQLFGHIGPMQGGGQHQFLMFGIVD